jgi:hypothetical protein
MQSGLPDGVAAMDICTSVVGVHRKLTLAEVKMAQKVSVSLQDDLDGSPATETVRFALAGSEYEIDLNEKHARAFRQQLNPFVKHARRAGKARPASRSAASRARTSRIRAWARDHGMNISDRGRIPANVVKQYQASAKAPAKRKAR